jgi:hypothetical protein
MMLAINMFKISARLISCFSGESYNVELDSNLSCARISGSYGVSGKIQDFQEFTLSSSFAKKFIDEVAEIIARPEQLRGDRSTTVYQVTVVLNGEEISTKSSEIPNKELIEIAEDVRTNPELRQKIQSTLKSGYHNWAHELFRVTQSFVRNCHKENQSSPPL